MNYKAVNQAFTSIVGDYLRRGYLLNTGTMGGLQSDELMHVDLTNGEEVIRVWMTSKWEFNDFGPSILSYHIIVGRVKDRRFANAANALASIWNDELEVLARKTFYSATKNRDKLWFVPYNEALKACQTRQERLHNKYQEDSLLNHELTENPKAVEIACEYLRNNLWLKRVHKKKVQVYRWNGRYCIKYCGKSYVLR